MNEPGVLAVQGVSSATPRVPLKSSPNEQDFSQPVVSHGKSWGLGGLASHLGAATRKKGRGGGRSVSSQQQRPKTSGRAGSERLVKHGTSSGRPGGKGIEQEDSLRTETTAGLSSYLDSSVADLSRASGRRSNRSSSRRRNVLEDSRVPGSSSSVGTRSTAQTASTGFVMPVMEELSRDEKVAFAEDAFNVDDIRQASAGSATFSQWHSSWEATSWIDRAQTGARRGSEGGQPLLADFDASMSLTDLVESRRNLSQEGAKGRSEGGEAATDFDASMSFTDLVKSRRRPLLGDNSSPRLGRSTPKLSSRSGDDLFVASLSERSGNKSAEQQRGHSRHSSSTQHSTPKTGSHRALQQGPQSQPTVSQNTHHKDSAMQSSVEQQQPQETASSRKTRRSSHSPRSQSSSTQRNPGAQRASQFTSMASYNAHVPKSLTHREFLQFLREDSLRNCSLPKQKSQKRKKRSSSRNVLLHEESNKNDAASPSRRDDEATKRSSSQHSKRKSKQPLHHPTTTTATATTTTTTGSPLPVFFRWNHSQSHLDGRHECLTPHKKWSPTTSTTNATKTVMRGLRRCHSTTSIEQFHLHPPWPRTPPKHQALHALFFDDSMRAPPPTDKEKQKGLKCLSAAAMLDIVQPVSQREVLSLVEQHERRRNNVRLRAHSMHGDSFSNGRHGTVLVRDDSVVNYGEILDDCMTTSSSSSSSSSSTSSSSSWLSSSSVSD